LPKTIYRQYENEDWTGLKVTEVVYGGDPRTPAAEQVFAYPDSAITVDALNRSSPGKKMITVRKIDNGKTASFSVTVFPLIWYAASPGLGGDDANSGLSADRPLATPQLALDKILAAYTGSWPGYGTGDVAEATVIVSGEIINTKKDPNAFRFYTEDMVIIKDPYPPLLIKGDPANPGTLDADRDFINEGRVLYIGAGNTVTLGEDITLTRGVTNKVNRNSGGAVYVDGGVFNMTGGTLSGNFGNEGGGVHVAGGTFTMTGGTIRDNNSSYYDGAGVYVRNQATFVMDGGTIRDNTAKYGGGVAVETNSEFIMHGGTIGDNSAIRYGGVFISDSTFTMNGGIITANTATMYGGGGVFIEAGAFTLNGGIISGNTGVHDDFVYPDLSGGGGVTLNGGTFTMLKGTINNNIIRSNDSSIDGCGGGVQLLMGTFTMSGGSICNNSADYGGGVYLKDVAGNNMQKTGGGIIENNTGTGESYYGPGLAAGEGTVAGNVTISYNGAWTVVP
jgi:hypothetical protein